MPPRSRRNLKRSQAAKRREVLSEFRRGTLRSGAKDGPKVTNRKRAIAIALSESGEAKRRRKTKRRSTEEKKRGNRTKR